MYTYIKKYIPEVLAIKTHNLFGKIIFWLGFLFFISGLGTTLGPLEFNSLLPNKSLALSFIWLGIAMLLISSL